MLEKYNKLQLKHKTTDELKVALKTIWEELPQEHVDKAVANFTKCLTADVAVAADGSDFEHLQLLCSSPSLHPHLISNNLALFRATNRLPVKTTLGMPRNRGVVLVEIAR